jgi:hypothetical protein
VLNIGRYFVACSDDGSWRVNFRLDNEVVYLLGFILTGNEVVQQAARMCALIDKLYFNRLWFICAVH